jgi:hypothetical protein
MGTSLVNQNHDEILVPSWVYVHLGPIAHELKANNAIINSIFFILVC